MRRGVIICVLAVFLLPATAQAAFPGLNGRIAFSSDRDGNPEIYSMRVDGSDVVRLTNHASQDVQPAWSPDGRWIAFASQRSGTSQIWIMDGDGNGARQLTTDASGAIDPAWSPDGSRLVYTSGGPELFTINADGTGRRTLLAANPCPSEYGEPCYEFADPEWSPDGDRIAFERLVTIADNDTGEIISSTRDIATVPTSGVALMTALGPGVQPSWSPDATRIAFSDAGADLDVFTMTSGGGNRQPLASTGGADHQAAWSPDVRALAFASTVDGDSEIHTIRADGSGLAQLTHNNATDSQPDWQPLAGEVPLPAHSGKIGYTAGGDIWTVNPNGSGAANLSGSAATETCALMSPNGAKIGYQLSGGGSIRVMNIDGSGKRRLPTRPNFLAYELLPAGCIEDWYPDGSAITFKHDDHCDAGGVWNVYLDGRDMDQIACPGPCSYDTTPDDPDWAPDGHRLAAVGCPWLTDVSDLGIVNRLGGSLTMLTNSPSQWEYEPSFSPDGTTIVFGLDGNAYRIDAAGTNMTLLATGASVPVWSPDGATLAFTKGGDVWTMNPDGSNQINLTNDPGADSTPVWSPEGQELAFVSNRDGDQDVYVMNRDGTGVKNVTNTSGLNEIVFGWARATGFPRPKGASPLHVSLVTAYASCAAPNRSHGPPLAFGSCAPPSKESHHLTVGTGDSNQRPARNEGFLRLETIRGDASTAADEADVAITFFSDDIFNLDLTDYSGELQASVPITITDQDNFPQPGAATTPSFALRVDSACTPTADPQEGSTCSASTTVDALIPGLIKEGRHTIWRLGQVVVYDGGPDGDAATVTGNTLFARQGVFIP